MDRNNRIGRRERCEILKITQGQGEGVTAVDKGQLGPLRPNTILEALEESIARRNREGDIWPTFLHSFGLDAASMAECKPRPHQQSATRAMSALGQKQTSRSEIAMSALPPKADIAEYDWDVRFVPKADICTAAQISAIGSPRRQSREGFAES